MRASCLLHASEAAVQVALEAIQALGGNGYINEYPTGRLLRDAKLYAIGAGTNEIRRMLIGRELFDGTVTERLPASQARHNAGERRRSAPAPLAASRRRSYSGEHGRSRVCRTAANRRA